MITRNTSFWELLTEWKINIPIIQRDYAQGRETESEKRERFLSAILESLCNEKKLDLDFVYGRIKDDIFFPIDGQQRLTTLFLLHWYTALKEKVPTDEKQMLNKFMYDTRISSREFCKSLIEEKFDLNEITEKIDFISAIRNKYWFKSEWNNDPTVIAMLIMIKSIHEKFTTKKVGSVWAKLTAKPLITFQVLDLGAKGFELTDELYIKMNARGKQLTPFENFKANLIQFIERRYKGQTLKHPIKGNISYSGYFSYRIEKEWTDLFWAFRGENSTIDNEFYNYFEFIAEMCFFRSNKNEKAEAFKNTFKQYEEIFSVEENLLFLFCTLDKLYEILTVTGKPDKKSISIFSNQSLMKQPIPNLSTGLKLFWNSTGGINLFERIIKTEKAEDARNKILLYCILFYLLKHNVKVADDGLKLNIRVIRNLLHAKRQRNETKYNTNARINEFGSYWNLLEQLCVPDVYSRLANKNINNKGSQLSDDSLNNEKEKARIFLSNPKDAVYMWGLEELDCLGGLIHLFKPKLNHSKFKDYHKAITEIWDNSIPDTKIIQALIVQGFEGLYIKDIKMGETYSFGRKDNWSLILTSEEEKISKSVLSLLEFYLTQSGASTNNKLEAIVSEWFKQNPKDRTWKYYFLKYPEFSCDINYYAWENDFEIRMLGSESSNPLTAYHINPYVLTVSRTINNKTICDEQESWVRYSENSGLMLKNGLTLKCNESGWEIDNWGNKLNSAITTKYKLSKQGKFYLLKDIPDYDRIETAVQFINDVI